MAILVFITGNDLTKQMYETLRKDVDWEHNPPSGLIFHSAAYDESGNTIHVADIWESEQDLNNFVENRLMPSMQKNNIPIPSKPEMFQIYSVNAYQGIDRYRKWFTNKSIEDKTIYNILKTAHHASSVGYPQPWNFVSIKDKTTRLKVKDSFVGERLKSVDLLKKI